MLCSQSVATLLHLQDSRKPKQIGPSCAIKDKAVIVSESRAVDYQKTEALRPSELEKNEAAVI